MLQATHLFFTQTSSATSVSLQKMNKLFVFYRYLNIKLKLEHFLVSQDLALAKLYEYSCLLTFSTGSSYGSSSLNIQSIMYCKHG